MLDYIWGALIIISLMVGIPLGRTAELNAAVFEGGKNAIALIIGLCGTICFWSGIMKVAEEAGITRVIGKALSPLLGVMFKGLSEQSKAAISLNMSANLLGLSNAATPFGLKAMSCLQQQNSNKLTASDNMVIFVVINTASLQIIPTTIASLRTGAGSRNPMEIMLPIWITSAAALLTGVIFAKALNKGRSSL